jgi:DNA-binding NarL/FixJ family response regulator
MGVPERILLVDDDEGFRNTIAVLLRREGLQCDVADSADRAAEMLGQGPYDLLITDHNGVASGDGETLRAVATGNGMLPVIVVTGQPSVSSAIEAMRSGVIDYLLKPVDFDELLRTVRRALETRKVARTLESLRAVLGDSHTVARIARRAATASNGASSDTLTPREREIVLALSNGQRVGAIAGKLGVSEHTVRNHLKAVYRKLDVHSQVELLSRWRAHAARP